VTFRRPKEDAQKAREWRAFTVLERELFDEAGLPGVLSEDREAFEDFLMHGFLAMPGGLADGARFDTEEQTATQRNALDKLAARYVERFGDPGVSLGPRPRHDDDLR
jgi:hypothetical protein